MSTLELNPLWIKGIRARCRWKNILGWGAIWLTIATFVFLVTYVTMVEQELTTSADAAKAALPGILVIQAVILMLFGTGAVASGVSQERDEGLLDYVRMTPMRPSAKVIGTLFGMPAREYLLFFATLPLVAIIVVISGFSLLTLGHFYLVFFSSVWVYHMTAMVVGMASPRPRLASMMSMGLVLLLYFALPNLSRIGITFFEFLTIRPTFLGMIQQELPDHLRAQAELNGIDTYRPVPFFEGAIQPTVYSLLVQGFIIITMFSIVHRKWRDQSHHLFSKAGGLLVFSGITVFTIASLWAIVSQEEAYRQLFNPLRRQSAEGRVPETLFFLMLTCFMIIGGAFLFMMCALTPSADCTRAGIRHARRLGHTRIAWNADAASSLPVALVMLAITIGAGVGIVSLAVARGDYMASGPSAVSTFAAVLLVIAVGLSIQGAAQRMSLKLFGVMTFLFWMVPCFATIILFAAFEAFEAGLYVSQPFPPSSIGYALSWMLETTAPPATYEGGFRFMPPEDEFTTSPARIVFTGAIGYACLAVLIQRMSLKHRRHLAQHA
ncbi:MAG: hypothetical protein KDA28_17360 [Phycisphaerales bacterium]|nr:hypothetical protein [Phycisphaerales bacterium]